MPKVSIIMPMYNSENYVQKTVDSVLQQTFQDFELIIINDCSTDNSIAVIQKNQSNKIRMIQNEENLGAAHSRNKGMQVAKGRFIAFIDSDDLWRSDKLEKQLAYMEQKKIGFCFSSYEKVKENEKVIRKVTAPAEVHYKDILKDTPIQISTVVFDTQLIPIEWIQFPYYKTSEDVALYLQVLEHGVTAYGMAESLVKYTVRKHSLSSNRVLNTMRRWSVYKSHHVTWKDRCINIIGHVNNSIKRSFPMEKWKRIKEVSKILTFSQIIDVFLFPFLWLFSLCYKPFCQKNIWLVQENANEACDNGYVFFQYLREHHKEIPAYYVIRKNAKDYVKVERLGNVIPYRSLKHWIYYLNAKKIIVTQKYANPSPAIFYLLHKYHMIKTPRIFLQHGITKDRCPMFFYDRTAFRLFICGAKREYEYVKDTFGYPKGYVVYTGFARFDQLDISSKRENKMILITPTWRKWIHTQEDFEQFLQHYIELVQDKKMLEALKRNKIKVWIVLHKNMKKFQIPLITLDEQVILQHNQEVEIQELINKADMLVTDFSSIYMDIAYRKRPMLYYQFDTEEYREKQLLDGYFSYEKDGFGEVLNSASEVINKIISYIESHFAVEKIYEDRMDAFFERKDKKNCKRIMEKIQKI